MTPSEEIVLSLHFFYKSIGNNSLTNRKYGLTESFKDFFYLVQGISLSSILGSVFAFLFLENIVIKISFIPMKTKNISN